RGAQTPSATGRLGKRVRAGSRGRTAATAKRPAADRLGRRARRPLRSTRAPPAIGEKSLGRSLAEWWRKMVWLPNAEHGDHLRSARRRGSVSFVRSASKDLWAAPSRSGIPAISRSKKPLAGELLLGRGVSSAGSGCLIMISPWSSKL